MIELIFNLPFGIWILVIALICITAAIVVMMRDDAAESAKWKRDLKRLDQEQRSRNFRDKL